MQTAPIDLLVTFDQNYIGPFCTMLASAVLNNPGERFRVWLLHGGIPAARLQTLEDGCRRWGVALHAVPVERKLFAEAPISERYPQEMYYRLLAAHLLPRQLHRALYLDPDILVINPLRPLWTLPLGGCAFAAASHAAGTGLLGGINRVRLETTHDYYNSGVMLLDLAAARAVVRPDEMFRCVREHGAELVLPDQDVFNRLYGAQTLPLDDAVWNYDARRYADYRLRSGGVCDMEWVMQHTAILHFCGRRKPWRPSYAGRFAALYKNYRQIALRAGAPARPENPAASR